MTHTEPHPEEETWRSEDERTDEDELEAESEDEGREPQKRLADDEVAESVETKPVDKPIDKTVDKPVESAQPEAQPGEPPRKRRGFAALSAEQRREIARRGGKASHASGAGHEFTSEEAREAGRRGGRSRWQSRR